MWVVKIGGSLNRDPMLPQWLDLVAQLGGGRVTLVCGGGSFADEVRRTQEHWQFDDLPAHNMAVLAMAQSAWLAHGLDPRLPVVRNHADLRRVLHSGQAAIWLPMDWLLDEPDAHANWDNTSDSIALDLARELNAERMVLVKSCPIDPLASLADLGAAGIVDRRFVDLAQGAGFPIDVLQRTEIERARALLLGGGYPGTA
jgi:5-(aminomethyl)-3-furanmethanol phosphate kinase